MSRWWRKRSMAVGGWEVWPSEASPGASCCGTSDQDVATQNRACCSVAWAEAHKALCSSPTAACWAIWEEWLELSYLGNAESVCMCLRPLQGGPVLETSCGNDLNFLFTVSLSQLFCWLANFHTFCIVTTEVHWYEVSLKNTPKHFFPQLKYRWSMEHMTLEWLTMISPSD